MSQNKTLTLWNTVPPTHQSHTLQMRTKTPANSESVDQVRTKNTPNVKLKNCR